MATGSVASCLQRAVSLERWVWQSMAQTACCAGVPVPAPYCSIAAVFRFHFSDCGRTLHRAVTACRLAGPRLGFCREAQERWPISMPDCYPPDASEHLPDSLRSRRFGLLSRGPTPASSECRRRSQHSNRDTQLRPLKTLHAGSTQVDF